MRTVASAGSGPISPTSLRRSAVASLLAATGVVASVILSAGPVSASPAPAAQGGEDYGTVDVVEVSGLLDPILVDFIEDALSAAEDAGSVALVLQLDSAGAVVDDADLVALASRIEGSEVPVSVWVGPSGAEASGRTAQLLAAVDDVGISPGSSIGDTGEAVLELDASPRFAQLDEIRDDSVGDERAVELGVADRLSPTLGNHLSEVEGVQLERVTNDDGSEELRPLTTTRFAQLGLVSQLLHTVASPAVAYLLLAIGLGLLLFELFTAGIGIAGVVGAVCAVLSAYGISSLPHSNVALGLLLLSMFAFGVDVQTGVPRVWTGIGLVSFVVGSVLLFTDPRPPWYTLAVGIAGMSAAMVSGMPSMVRTRFATPTIGREWMVGAEGDAVSDVDPDGTVRIDGAMWRARTNRATPVSSGDRIRVIAIDGLTLEIEPEEGGARDHRERRSHRVATGVEGSEAAP